MPLIEAATPPEHAKYLRHGARRDPAATPWHGGTKHPQAAAISATDWLRLPQIAPMRHLQQQYCRQKEVSNQSWACARCTAKHPPVVCSHDTLELTTGRQNYRMISAAAHTCSGTSCCSVLAASSGLLCSSTPTDAVCRVTRFSYSLASTPFI